MHPTSSCFGGTEMIRLGNRAKRKRKLRYQWISQPNRERCIALSAQRQTAHHSGIGKRTKRKIRTWIWKTTWTRQTAHHHTVWQIGKTGKQSTRTDTQSANDNPCRPNHHRLRKPGRTVGGTTKSNWETNKQNPMSQRIIRTEFMCSKVFVTALHFYPHYRFPPPKPTQPTETLTPATIRLM